MQIATDTASAKIERKYNSTTQIKSTKLESFKERFLAFSDQFSLEKDKKIPGQVIDCWNQESAAPIFYDQIMSLIKNNNSNQQLQQKNKRKQKQQRQ